MHAILHPFKTSLVTGDITNLAEVRVFTMTVMRHLKHYYTNFVVIYTIHSLSAYSKPLDFGGNHTSIFSARLNLVL